MTSHDRSGSSSSYSHPSSSTQGPAASHRSSGSSRSFTTDSAVRHLHDNPSLSGAVEEEEEENAALPQSNREEQENSVVLRFYLSSLTVKRRGRWGHLHRWRARAKIIKFMEKLWVNDYPRIISRRVLTRIDDAIPESAEE